jgi:hypothetical protein
MWPWGALPLLPPSHEAAGTCRVAWDALPLLPQAILASYFLDAQGAVGAFFVQASDGRHALAGKQLIRGLPPSLERQTLAGCRRSIRYLSPSLERQTRARGKVPDRPLARRRLSGFSSGPENPHGACSLPAAATITDGGTPARGNGRRDSCRTRRWIRWALRAPCKFSGSAENLLRCCVLEATDPGPSPERVSAFPSSGEGPGSVVNP